jgi:hypothetical protein
MSHRVLRRLLVATGVACVVLPAAPAFAGDPNAGDVWVDNVIPSGPQYGGPGHEMDPHLACADINLWGAKLADGKGDYTIDGWAPSGSQQQAYKSSWIYAGSGSQVIDVINVQTLIAKAVANGDTPQANQGFHFKLQFSQDPQKHKTFWVNCPVPSSSPTPPPGGGNTPGGPNTPGGGHTPGSGGGNTPPGGGTTANVRTSMSATRVSIGAAKSVRCPRGTSRSMKRVHGHRVLACVAKKRRHVAANRQHRPFVRRRDPSFTG